MMTIIKHDVRNLLGPLSLSELHNIPSVIGGVMCDKHSDNANIRCHTVSWCQERAWENGWSKSNHMR